MMRSEIARRLRKIEQSLNAESNNAGIRVLEAYFQYANAQEGSSEEKAALAKWLRIDSHQEAEKLSSIFQERIEATKSRSAENERIAACVPWAADALDVI